VTVPVGERQSRIMAAAVARGINLRDVGADRIGISVDETTTEADLEAVCRAFGILKPPAQVLPAIPDALMRETDYLTHPIFHMNRAESEMMRYMRRLSDRDLALDRAMIPLGSCTMKLNASVEMMPITWPEFNAIHPSRPPTRPRVMPR
jgi:glycine dehydrogenase